MTHAGIYGVDAFLIHTLKISGDINLNYYARLVILLHSEVDWSSRRCADVYNDQEFTFSVHRNITLVGNVHLDSEQAFALSNASFIDKWWWGSVVTKVIACHPKLTSAEVFEEFWWHYPKFAEFIQTNMPPETMINLLMPNWQVGGKYTVTKPRFKRNHVWFTHPTLCR